MLIVVDYGMGNLRSVAKALVQAGGQPQVSSMPGVVAQATQLVVPGVGAGPQAMKELTSRGLLQPVVQHIQQGKPYLGICLGLQLLFDATEELGGCETWRQLRGTVRRFQPTNPQLKVPHMGWNRIQRTAAARECPLLKDITDGSYMYFVHSYYVDPADDAVAATTTDYGQPFVSAVWRGALFATQFHPEKSQRAGLQLLRNFMAQ